MAWSKTGWVAAQCTDRFDVGRSAGKTQALSKIAFFGSRHAFHVACLGTLEISRNRFRVAQSVICRSTDRVLLFSE